MKTVRKMAVVTGKKQMGKRTTRGGT